MGLRSMWRFRGGGSGRAELAVLAEFVFNRVVMNLAIAHPRFQKRDLGHPTSLIFHCGLL